MALLDTMAEADHEKGNESDMQKDHVDDENHGTIEGIIKTCDNIFTLYDYIFTRTLQ